MKKHSVAALFLAACMMLGLASCSGDSEGSSQSQSSEPEQKLEYPVEFENFVITEKPDKIVSLSPGITELIYEMDYDKQLVGVSDYCDYPEGKMEEYLTCGSPLEPNFENLKTLKPDLVITAAPLAEADLIQLQQMDINVLVLPRASTIDALKQNYLNLFRVMEGITTGGEKGNAWYADIQKDLDTVSQKTKAYLSSGGKKLTAAIVAMTDYTIATGDTLESKLLEAANLTNIASGYGQWIYPEANWTDFKPDVIFVDQSIGLEGLQNNEKYKNLDAVKNGRVLEIDMKAFERQSKRMFDAFVDMAVFAYEDAFQGAESSASQSEQPSESSAA